MTKATETQLLFDKVAIVTGGSRGIGNAIALDLARNGAHVAINYRRSVDAANELVERIEDLQRKGFAVQADVASYTDAQKMTEEVMKKFGRLDILVKNAGVNRDGVIWKMAEE